MLTALVLATLLQGGDGPWSVDEWQAWSAFGEGSTVTFETAMGRSKVRMIRTMVKKEADRIVLTEANEMGGRRQSPGERAVARPDPAVEKPANTCPACTKHAAREFKTGKEKLVVAGKELECDWTDELKVTCEGKRESVVKVWTHKDVPGWIVKVESPTVGHAPLVLVSFEAKK